MTFEEKGVIVVYLDGGIVEGGNAADIAQLANREEGLMAELWEKIRGSCGLWDYWDLELSCG
jgi:hypothetical protein